MKKSFLLLLLLTAFIQGNSQSLSNTSWLGTKPPSPNIWFQFGNDTLFYTLTGSGYAPLSVFTSGNGLFSIFDLPGASLCTDTGDYTFVINGNHLVFSLVSDICSSRRNNLLNYTWTQIGGTGISDLQNQNEVSIYPNPVQDKLNLQSKFASIEKVTIYNLLGEKMLSLNSENANCQIDVSTFQSGVYFVEVFSDGQRSMKKVVRE